MTVREQLRFAKMMNRHQKETIAMMIKHASECSTRLRNLIDINRDLEATISGAKLPWPCNCPRRLPVCLVDGVCDA